MTALDRRGASGLYLFVLVVCLYPRLWAHGFVGGVFNTLLVTMYVNVTVPTRTRVRFNMGKNLGLSGTDFSGIGRGFGGSGFANFFVNPVTRFGVPVMKLKMSTTLLFTRENVGISSTSTSIAIGRGNVSVPIGLGCGVNLNDLTNVCLTTNPSFCFSFRGGAKVSGGGTRMNVGMNTNLGLLGRLRIKTGCGVPLNSATSVSNNNSCGAGA